MDDISKMTNEELDAALAVAQGWHKVKADIVTGPLHDSWVLNGRVVQFVSDWHPTTSIAQAMGLLDDFPIWSLGKNQREGGIYACYVYWIPPDYPKDECPPSEEGIADTVERVISEAVLAAMRQGKEGSDAETTDKP